MTLYLFDWPDRRSILVDERTSAAAAMIAREAAEGVAPQRMRELPPGVLVCDLYAEDDGDEDAIILEPLPHVLDALGDLLDDDPATAPTQPAPLRLVGACTAEATDAANKVIRCELPPNHPGHHAYGELAWKNRT